MHQLKKAVLNYSKSLDGSTNIWFMDALSNINEIKKNFGPDPKITFISDLRGFETVMNLDENGFQLVNSPTNIPCSQLLSGDEAIKESYYEESEKVIKNVTGCSEVIFFDYTIRKSELNAATEKKFSNNQPHQRVHIDQTASSALERVKFHAPHQLETESRFQIINLWRPIQNIVYDYPLALLDYKTLNINEDLEVTQLHFPNWLKDRESYSVKYNSKHKWYYWSQMMQDEVIMFKCYDSACLQLHNKINTSNNSSKNSISGVCAHSAFKDEEGIQIGIPRQSVEIRALTFFNY